MVYSLQTGKTGFERRFGKPIFEYYSQNLEAGQLFDQAMSGGAAMHVPGILANYDFSPFGRITDVGGGQGSFLCAMLGVNPNATGILFDRPEVAEGANRFLESRGVSARAKFAGGDIFQTVPEGADLYTIKWVLHDFDDEQCLRILRNIRRAMTSAQARLLVIEGVTPDDLSASVTAYYDLHMMVMTGGRERSPAGFAQLFEQAGLEFLRVITAPALLTTALIEARAA